MNDITRKRRNNNKNSSKNSIKKNSKNQTRKIKPVHVYKTFHNYSDKYIIEDYGKYVKIYNTVYDEKLGKKVKGTKLIKIAYKEIISARDPFKHTAKYGGKWLPAYRHANMLIHVSADQYIFVGYRVVGFRPFKGDEIYNFLAYMGNNEVMYPYAVGKLYTYLLNEGVALPNNILKPNDDPYRIYYDASMHKKTIPGLLKIKEKVFGQDLQ